MQHILDAIESDQATSEDFAALEVPDSYRAAFVKKDETEMFAGMPARRRTRASRCTSTRWRCPSSARARRWSR